MIRFWDRPGQPDEMPFLDHLEDLRWRILKSLIALAIGAVVGFLLVMHFNVLGLLIKPVQPYLNGSKLKYLSPADPFFITMKLGITVGVLMVFPFVAYQIWGFFSPALLPEEKRAVVPALYFGFFLFLCGGSLAYFGVLPVGLKFLLYLQKQSLEQNLIVGSYLGFVLKLVLGFGIVFETPVVMLVLATVGIVNSDMLRNTRRYAIVAIFVISAVLTPPDVFTQMLMATPLLLLYEVSIWLVKWAERRRNRRLEELGVDTGEEEQAEETEETADAGS